MAAPNMSNYNVSSYKSLPFIGTLIQEGSRNINPVCRSSITPRFSARNFINYQLFSDDAFFKTRRYRRIGRENSPIQSICNRVSPRAKTRTTVCQNTLKLMTCSLNNKIQKQTNRQTDSKTGNIKMGLSYVVLGITYIPLPIPQTNGAGCINIGKSLEVVLMCKRLQCFAQLCIAYTWKLIISK